MLPRHSCRLGRACKGLLLRSFFGLVWSSRAEEVRREVGFMMMPESRFTRIIGYWLTPPEAQDPETQPQFVYSGGRDSFAAFHWELPTKERVCARTSVKKCCTGA